MEAFWWLSRRRQYGMNGPQPLSPNDLRNYIEMKRIDDGEAIDDLMHFIGLLDDEWMNDWYKRSEERQKQKASTGKKF